MLKNLDFFFDNFEFFKCPSRNEKAAPAKLASFETARIISNSEEVESCRDCCKIEDLSFEFLNALKGDFIIFDLFLFHFLEKLREI